MTNALASSTPYASHRRQISVLFFFYFFQISAPLSSKILPAFELSFNSCSGVMLFLLFVPFMNDLFQLRICEFLLFFHWHPHILDNIILLIYEHLLQTGNCDIFFWPDDQDIPFFFLLFQVFQCSIVTKMAIFSTFLIKFG